ncbi:MAG: hypothetical protein V4534_05540 [Myxococcota bacterium]
MSSNPFLNTTFWLAVSLTSIAIAGNHGHPPQRGPLKPSGPDQKHNNSCHGDGAAVAAPEGENFEETAEADYASSDFESAAAHFTHAETFYKNAGQYADADRMARRREDAMRAEGEKARRLPLKSKSSGIPAPYVRDRDDNSTNGLALDLAKEGRHNLASASFLEAARQYRARDELEAAVKAFLNAGNSYLRTPDTQAAFLSFDQAIEMLMALALQAFEEGQPMISKDYYFRASTLIGRLLMLPSLEAYKTHLSFQLAKIQKELQPLSSSFQDR